MHYKTVLRFTLCFSAILLSATISTASVCSSVSPTRSLLSLSIFENHLNQSILQSCPGGTKYLEIVASDLTTRFLSNDIFHGSHVPLITTLIIKVKKLYIVNEKFVPFLDSKLSTISLAGCGVTSLPFGLFRHLPVLKQIDLSSNYISSLPPDLLLYSPLVTHVNLSSNRLKMLPFFKLGTPQANLSIDVSGNPIECNCANVLLSEHIKFFGDPACSANSISCNTPPIQLTVNVTDPEVDTYIVPILASQSLSISCRASSQQPIQLFWISPIGIIPPNPELSLFNISYQVQPILEPTVINSIQGNSESNIFISNVRGHLAGDWYCVAKSNVDIVVSKPLQIDVRSSMYHSHVYYISLCYGYGGMIVLLMIGIIGGTIRYCSETRCLRRPQPPFAYGGKAFIGVIPVPEVDDEEISEKFIDDKVGYISESSVRYISAKPICAICSRPPTYWFCQKCTSVHFAESILTKTEQSLTDPELPIGVLSSEGEIKLHDHNLPSTLSSVTAVPRSVLQNGTDPHQPLMQNAINLTDNMEFPNSQRDLCDSCRFSDVIYVRSGNCVIKVVQMSDNTLEDGGDNVLIQTSSIKEAICMHSKPRTNKADVKLIVSNEKLAEEYRSALEDLARAVESPDIACFREHLEEFRSRLRRDVGHGVKVLRGEFQDFRAKSARGVANLRNQSSMAAQRFRAGITHGVEHMRGSIKSVAELCGASGTIGQTISVVSVYVDETDQVKKQKVISDFVF